MAKLAKTHFLCIVHSLSNDPTEVEKETHMSDFIKVFCLTLVIFMSVTSVTSAETAKDAMLALKKLEARTQVGISYDEYAPALGEAKFVVNLYLENNTKDDTELLRKIAEIMDLYEFANVIWGQKFEETASYGCIFINAGGIFSYSDAVAMKYLKLFPEDNKSFSDGGVLKGAPQTIDGIVVFPRFYGHSVKLGCHSLQLE